MSKSLEWISFPKNGKTGKKYWFIAMQINFLTWEEISIQNNMDEFPSLFNKKEMKQTQTSPIFIKNYINNQKISVVTMSKALILENDLFFLLFECCTSESNRFFLWYTKILKKKLHLKHTKRFAKFNREEKSNTKKFAKLKTGKRNQKNLMGGGGGTNLR